MDPLLPPGKTADSFCQNILKLFREMKEDKDLYQDDKIKFEWFIVKMGELSIH